MTIGTKRALVAVGLAMAALTGCKKSATDESAIPEPNIVSPCKRLVSAFPGMTFDKPVDMQAPSFAGWRGPYFVVEVKGRIWRVFRKKGVWKRELALDIRSNVLRSFNEEGLLSLALHPTFEETGRAVIAYSADKPRRLVIAEIVAVAGDFRATKPRTVLEVPQPFANHNGCPLAFGPDGKLYAGIGDGGSRDDPMGNGQNVSTLLGSIIRIDVDKQDPGKPYAIPPDNPLVGKPEARGELWAWGLRNPWRIAFDSQDGRLWAGDVGQDAREEVDIIVRGGNYGWNLREGRAAFDRGKRGVRAPGELIDPVHDYGRKAGGCITGGLVYRGRLGFLVGAYVFGDYNSGSIWALTQQGESWAPILLCKTSIAIAGFATDPRGRLFVIDHGEGIVWRLAR